MNKEWTIAVASFLAVTIMAVGGFFGFPGRAHADIGTCLAQIIGGKVAHKILVGTAQGTATGQIAGASGASGAMTPASALTSVPVYDAAVQTAVISEISASTNAINTVASANANINSETAAQTQGLSFQRCVIQPLVIIMARSLLNTFTAQTVSWINSGFKGSPLFVTNPQGFMADVADQTLGQFIANLGPIGAMLCGPFDLQLRLSLNLAYGGSGYWQEIGCRLTDIEQNVQRAFTGGAWGENGWDNWLQLTAVPQNNPYGAYIAATNALDARIGNAQFSLGQQLNWGSGFLSSVNPKTGEIQTPGRLIEDQLSNTLGEPVRQIGVAQDLDAILNALVGQMINQVMGGVGGLLGASSHQSGGGYSAVEQGMASTPDAVIAANTAAKTFPVGLLVETGVTRSGAAMTIQRTRATNPSQTDPTPAEFCAAFRRNSYSANTDGTGGAVTDTSPVYVTAIGTLNADGAVTSATISPAAHTEKIGGTVWAVSDYNAAIAFCNGFASPIADATAAFQNQIDTAVNNVPDVTTPPEETGPAPDVNIAIGKTASQSSNYDQTTTADKAVSGTNRKLAYAQNGVTGAGAGSCLISGISDFSCAAETRPANTAPNPGSAFWQIDLGGNYNIHSIELDHPFGSGWSNLSIAQRGSEIRVRVLDTNGKDVANSPIKHDASQCNGQHQDTFTFCDDNNGNMNLSLTGLTMAGQYVRIEKDDGALALGQVKIMGSRVTAGPSGGGAQPAAPAFTVSPEGFDYTTPGLACPVSGGEAFPCAPNGSIVSPYDVTFSVNQAQNGIKARLSIMKINGDAVNVASVFKNLSLTEKVDNGSPGTSSVTLNGTLNINQPLILFTDDTARDIGATYEISVGGNIAINAAWGNYKMTIDLLDSGGKVIATQTTSFKIQ